MENGNTINIYAVDEIIEVAKMFEKQGLKFKTVFTKETDLKFSKKELDVHSSDIFQKDKTKVFILNDDDTKYHRMWFKLISYNENNFESWKLVSESIEYK